jgi:hypothetical protein
MSNRTSEANKAIALAENSKSSNGDYADGDYTTSPPTNINEEHNTAQEEDIRERSSPRKHIVSEHCQHYHGELKKKEPYKRGKSSDE